MNEKITNDGGFLVPEYIWTKREGTRAWLFRAAGRMLKRTDLFNKGMERHEFASLIADIIKRKNKLEKKTVITLPK